MTLRDRLFLHWHNYCPLHLTPKTYWFRSYVCDLCNQEWLAKRDRRIAEIRSREAA